MPKLGLIFVWHHRYAGLAGTQSTLLLTTHSIWGQNRQTFNFPPFSSVCAFCGEEGKRPILNGLIVNFTPELSLLSPPTQKLKQRSRGSCKVQTRDVKLLPVPLLGGGRRCKSGLKACPPHPHLRDRVRPD